MRFFSIITALVVTAVLYLVVFERDKIMSFANGGAQNTAQQASDEPQEVTEVTETADDAPRVVSIVALRSSAKPIDNAVLLRGRTEATRQIDVRAETSGLVNSEPLRKGSTVEAGQLLCEISPGIRLSSLAEAQARLPEAQARLPEAKGHVLEADARLKEAQINDNAAKQLSAGGFASEIRVAGTQAAVQSALASIDSAAAGVVSARAGILAAEAAIAMAENEIDHLKITAPFAGLLETDTAELGALMQPGGLCATIIQLNPIKLVAFAAESEVAKIKVGARAGGRTTAGQTVEGSVTFISRSSDPETRTFRVEVTVPNDDLALSDGQSTEILIGAAGQNAHLIPASSITLNNEGALGVQLATDDNRAQFAPISIVRDTTDGIWVTGLADEVNIIITGQEYVSDGVAIKTTFAQGSKS